ncbi:MAG: 16S rRNA (adenine(1518)-N(6)/adenine(1519)-N(6))-dimethyltransferase RsmA [Gammaproteobacteria bacterium]|nr:16S rRNA (adenine(1518)-N(6)/adenine(1519)-N(6))-dimethyltransferase RsmA [Gammaproteobacteria bacterium]
MAGPTPKKHQARKRFGQNFLQDQGIIRHIVACIRPKPKQNIVEIGPGLGAITEHLLAAAGHLDVVELDRDLLPHLRISFASYGANLRIHEADALKFDFKSLSTHAKSLRIVGNLPYNISTPLIFHLLEQADCIEDMHFMLQKEVVLRLAAGAGTNNYGRLSIMAQYYCRVDHLFEVPPEAFDPRPKVDSAIVRMAPYAKLPHVANDFKHFEQLVKSGFAQRRKTLRNNLKGIANDEQLQSLGIDPSIRPERLTVANFVAISNLLTQIPS